MDQYIREHCVVGSFGGLRDRGRMESELSSRVDHVEENVVLTQSIVRAQTRVMENNPPPSARQSLSPMHSRPHSKSSPAKRNTTRVLTPHLNHLSAPSDDVFQTGLLTPHASQNAVEMEAAKSLISPPPEGSAQAGTSRQHVCLTSESDFTLENPALTFSTS